MKVYIVSYFPIGAVAEINSLKTDIHYNVTDVFSLLQLMTDEKGGLPLVVSIYSEELSDDTLEAVRLAICGKEQLPVDEFLTKYGIANEMLKQKNDGDRQDLQSELHDGV